MLNLAMITYLVMYQLIATIQVFLDACLAYAFTIFMFEHDNAHDYLYAALLQLLLLLCCPICAVSYSKIGVGNLVFNTVLPHPGSLQRENA